MKQSWKSLLFNSQNIEVETNRAVLINLPFSSKYKGWSFWHPKKLIKVAGGKGYYLSLLYTDNWKFKIFSKTSEEYVSAAEIEEAFNKANESISFSIANTKPEQPIHVPEKLPLSDRIEVVEELKDD